MSSPARSSSRPSPTRAGRRSCSSPPRSSSTAAARECFVRLGVQKARMEDIARAAGISRQAIYRYVSGRDDLVELAILERCREIGAQLQAGTASKPRDVVAAMVDLMLRAIRIS